MTAAQETEASDLFSRLRSYSRELFSLDRRPLIDQSFSFPWSELSAVFTKVFGCNLAVSPGTLEWKAKDDLFKGIVAPSLPIALSIPGVNGQIILLISHSDIQSLMSHLLHIDMATLLKQDPSFFDQFLLFLTTELVACARGIPALQSISPRMTQRQETESAGCLCQDIAVVLEGEHSLARLIIPPEFLESWRTLRMGEDPKSSASLADVETTLSVEAGRTYLSPEKIAELRSGDFLLLDHPFFIPNSSKARLFLTQNGHPLFRAKLQDGNLKILEMPLQHEAFLPIGGLSMAMKEPIAQQAESQSQRADPLPPSRQSRSTPSHPQTPSEENPFEGEEAEEGSAEMMTEEEMERTAPMAAGLAKNPVNINQLPLTVVVELTELSMSIEQLAALQPGNLLDLDIRPENGVMLMVNGKIFAQGEMVRIGDNVGVRITQTVFQQPSPHA